MQTESEIRELLDSVERMIREHGRAGGGRVQVDPAVMNRLGAVARPAASAPAASAAPVRPAEGVLAELETCVRDCTRCPLHEGRTKTVFGAGNPRARILFVGEAPGRDEDRQGIPFVGRAGELLTRIIAAMGMTRDDVYIGNIVKCRPPDNRTPLPEEMDACVGYLQSQIDVIRPEVIVAMGRVALQGLVDVRGGITRLRGSWLSYRGIAVMPTFHPAYLLRNAAAKREVWDDMKAVLDRLGLPIPPRTSR